MKTIIDAPYVSYLPQFTICDKKYYNYAAL